MSTRKNEILRQGLLLDLYRRGLGELLVMHHTDREVLLGNIVMEKGRLVLKDLGLMKQISPSSVGVCWDLGIIGAVCNLPKEEWESMSFLGVDHCKFPVDLSSTRKGLLASGVGQYDESVLHFKGSIYRGIKLALEAQLLPIVLLHPIKTDEGVPGLAVADLKFASIPISVLVKLNDLVRTSVDKKSGLELLDTDISDDEFQKLFGDYLE